MNEYCNICSDNQSTEQLIKVCNCNKLVHLSCLNCRTVDDFNITDLTKCYQCDQGYVFNRTTKIHRTYAMFKYGCRTLRDILLIILYIFLIEASVYCIYDAQTQDNMRYLYQNNPFIFYLWMILIFMSYVNIVTITIIMIVMMIVVIFSCYMYLCQKPTTSNDIYLIKLLNARPCYPVLVHLAKTIIRNITKYIYVKIIRYLLLCVILMLYLISLLFHVTLLIHLIAYLFLIFFTIVDVLTGMIILHFIRMYKLSYINTYVICDTRSLV